VKVFGIGLARTGTASLNQALRSLGFTAEHFPRSYDAILKHDCVTDTSVTVGYKYLDFMFPGSKFILTTRPVEPWLESVRALFQHLGQAAIADRYHHMHYALYRTTVFDEQRLLTSYNAHLDDALDYFAGRPDQLLVLDVTKGDPYAPLCKFLGVDHPGTAFPLVNERAGLATRKPALDT
jgi:Sulfotransferase domain